MHPAEGAKAVFSREAREQLPVRMQRLRNMYEVINVEHKRSPAFALCYLCGFTDPPRGTETELLFDSGIVRKCGICQQEYHTVCCNRISEAVKEDDVLERIPPAISSWPVKLQPPCASSACDFCHSYLSVRLLRCFGLGHANEAVGPSSRAAQRPLPSSSSSPFSLHPQRLWFALCWLHYQAARDADNGRGSFF